MNTNAMPLVVVDKLKKYFPVGGGVIFQRKTGLCSSGGRHLFFDCQGRDI